MDSPELLKIDYVDSHARLRASDVELVLSGLTGEVADRSALVLTRDGSTVSAPAEVRVTGGTSELRARTPRSGLTDGHWSVTLAGETPRTIDARLLVQGARPLVLLLGAQAPRSVVPKGRPAAPSGSVGARVVRRLARTVRR